MFTGACVTAKCRRNSMIKHNTVMTVIFKHGSQLGRKKRNKTDRYSVGSGPGGIGNSDIKKCY